MASKFEDLVNGMVNVSLGAAAVAAEKSKEILEDLGAKGEQVRTDPTAPDFGRSMAEVFSRAGGAVSEATERLSASGATTAEKILDELIRTRVRGMSPTERTEFVGHVKDLVDSVDTPVVEVEVEVEVVPEDGDDADGDACDAGAQDADAPAEGDRA